MKRIFQQIIIVAAVVVAGGWSAAASILVYDNSTGDQFARMIGNGAELGDQIILDVPAPTAEVDYFRFQYFLEPINLYTLSGSEQARIHFYQMDGAPVSGYASPGTTLWDSGWFNIQGTTRNTYTFDNTTAGFPVTLPKEFTWSVEFQGLGSDPNWTARAGVDLYTPPTTGQNYPDYWMKQGGNWSLLTLGFGYTANFGAQVGVVPEPAALAWGLVSGLAAVLTARRLKRS